MEWNEYSKRRRTEKTRRTHEHTRKGGRADTRWVRLCVDNAMAMWDWILFASKSSSSPLRSLSLCTLWCTAPTRIHTYSFSGKQYYSSNASTHLLTFTHSHGHPIEPTAKQFNRALASTHIHLTDAVFFSFFISYSLRLLRCSGRRHASKLSFVKCK